MGGEVDLRTIDLERAKTFAKNQDPKKYKIGSVGPTTYDCSSFMSAIINVLRGKKGNARFTRLFGTATMSTVLPTLGFQQGRGDANDFTIGWYTKKEKGTKYGHTAGSLGGVNVECRGGKGVVIGPAARSPGDKMFKHHMHLSILAAPRMPPRPAPKPFPGITLKKGDTGRHVKLIQAHRQMHATGEVDKKTWDRLMGFLRPPKVALHRVGKPGQTLNLREQAKRSAKKYFKSDKPNAVEVMLRRIVDLNPQLAGQTTIPGGTALKVPTSR